MRITTQYPAVSEGVCSSLWKSFGQSGIVVLYGGNWVTDGVLRRYSDIIMALSIPAVFLLILFYVTDPVALYFRLGLGTTFLTVFGVLLGLLITAYAIFFTATPSLPKDLISTDAFERIGRIFFGLILMNIFFVAMGISTLFLSSIVADVFAAIEVAVSLFLLSFTFLIMVYLRELFMDLRENLRSN